MGEKEHLRKIEEMLSELVTRVVSLESREIVQIEALLENTNRSINGIRMNKEIIENNLSIKAELRLMEEFTLQNNKRSEPTSRESSKNDKKNMNHSIEDKTQKNIPNIEIPPIDLSFGREKPLIEKVSEKRVHILKPGNVGDGFSGIFMGIILSFEKVVLYGDCKRCTRIVDACIHCKKRKGIKANLVLGLLGEDVLEITIWGNHISSLLEVSIEELIKLYRQEGEIIKRKLYILYVAHPCAAEVQFQNYKGTVGPNLKSLRVISEQNMIDLLEYNQDKG